MKCLLLAPLRYPFIHSITAGMEACGMDVKAVDFRDLFSSRVNGLYNGYTSLPRRIRKLWEEPYVRRTNENYRRIFREFKPDLVFIYNDQLVLPDLLTEFRKTARIAFFLGDNPLYTPTNIHNLSILFKSDHTICPDSFWCSQLTRMGIDNVVFDCFGINHAQYHPMQVTAADSGRYSSDLAYVGSASKTNWGYKRALFLNLFKDLDLKAYISGNGMERWYGAFPELENKIVPHEGFDAAFNNVIYNCAKIAPVELVPSLFNGIHVRVFDALGAGILPLCEESRDLERVFEGIDLPLIRDYREAGELAVHWLSDDSARKELIDRLRARAIERHAPELVIQRLIRHVFPSWS